MKNTKSSRILIVDDETNIRLMLRTALTTDGYSVSEAGDGRMALEMIDQTRPDLVILDLSMPKLDGLGVLQELRGVRPIDRPRVIVLTAYGSIATAVKATRLGAMDFVEKPVSVDEIRESVDAALIEPLPVDQSPGSADPLAGGYGAVLDRVRKALRMANYADAETLMMKAADLAQKDAAYLNLLGVLFESQRKWRLARKCYNKAISADGRYEPPQRNLRRLIEMKATGRTEQPIVLGDEPDDVWFARLPD